MTAPVRLGLTREQRRCLSVIEKGIADNGVPPSYDEMMQALSLRSKGGVHRLVKALEERGYIKRLPNRARSIALTHQPTDRRDQGSRTFLDRIQSLESEAYERGMVLTGQALNRAKNIAGWQMAGEDDAARQAFNGEHPK